MATFYAMFSTEPRPPTVVHVCDDIACRVNGAEELIEDARARAGRRRRGRHVVREPMPRAVRAGAGRLPPAAGRGRLDTTIAPGHRVEIGPFRRGVGRPQEPARVLRPDRRRARSTAAAGRHVVDPAIARRLPGARRLRGAAARRRARTRGRDPRGQGLEAPRARRRGVPDRREVGGGRRAAGAAALLRLQRGRVGARHVQGPRADGAGSRSPWSRRSRSPGFATGSEQGFIYIRGEYPLATSTLEHAIDAGARARVPRRRRDGGGVRVRRRAPSRRGRLHLRRGDGAVQLDRGQARRAAQQAAVPRRARASSASPPASTTSRRW